ncbi:unnamed protein product [Adineta steineri]|uniref:Uncharacterized protein n=1 Tax=Adineta steineri TaxID=433720 RepID=A0A813TDV5_9BILA|nr:unnamed protein product [Adineta steineri]
MITKRINGGSRGQVDREKYYYFLIKNYYAQCKHLEYLNNISRAIEEGLINTCVRKSTFLAQIAHESGELRYMTELGSHTKYEGRKDLGNTQKGDGERFKGRGPI